MTAKVRLGRVVVSLFAALTVISCGESPAVPSSSSATSNDPKDLAEALLVGTGPLSANGGGCARAGIVSGWESGSVITVRVSLQLPQLAQGQIQQVVGRIAEATLGNVNATIQLTDQPDPQPKLGEITVWGFYDPAQAGCPPGAILCTSYPGFSTPFIRAARIVGVPTGNFPHELGHGVFGFCHTRNPNAFDSETIMAGGYALTDRDVGIVQSVYRAGLGPGATRADLVKAGIVNP